MPERTFGRSVRYRRTKLGLSQAKLGELVGRSPSTIRSWEREKTTPTDNAVISALAAVLDLDERSLLEKAGLEKGAVEDQPTVEEALASLAPTDVDIPETIEEEARIVASTEPVPPSTDVDSILESETFEHVEEEMPDESAGEPDADFEPFPVSSPQTVGAMATQPAPKPAYLAPPEPFVYTAPTPAAEPSYVEDNDQRQLYRIRNLATFVLIVALILLFALALIRGLDALGSWWDSFVSTLNL
ncbi:MAG: helix-turn-helix domain-containing protein [Acidimicrobiia bacterium]